MPSKTASRSRHSASERRDTLVRAAVGHFAMTGLHGTAVGAITDEVGITQPYAFSLFGTKKGLFIATVEHGFDRVQEEFRAAAVAVPDGYTVLQSLGEAYAGLLDDRALLLVQLQAYAASGDPEVREVVRRRFAGLYDLVRELTGADAAELQGFFANGMLLNVAAALDLPELLGDESWIADCLGEPAPKRDEAT